MTDSRTEDTSIAPRRSLAGKDAGSRPVLPPAPEGLRDASTSEPAQPTQAAGTPRAEKPPRGARQPKPAGAERTRPVPQRSPAQASRTRRARLRLVQVDAWSVMKTAFLLSIAIGIVTVVAVGIVWGVLGAAGVWDSINSMVQQSVGSENGTPFEIQDYVSTSRVLGFTMIVAVADVVLITAIATLGAFLYNLSATLLGGVEVTLAEDN